MLDSEAPDLKRTRRRVVRTDVRDRLPPNSPESERGILGCIMLSPKDVVPQCIERFKGCDDVMYDLRNQTIYNEFVAMYDTGVAIDIITLQQRLKDKQLLDQVGGIACISALPDAVPSAANIAYYLDIVHEKYVLRKMIHACTNAVASIYDHEGDVDTLLDEVERDVLKVGESRVKENSHDMLTLVKSAIDTIEDSHQHQGVMRGLSTGFVDLDKLTAGLHAGDMIIIAARPSTGKAQPLDAKILTPDGFVYMGEISIGSTVIGSDGLPHRVVGVFPQGVKDVFTVEFSDGSRTMCTEDHLWFTQTRDERRRRNSCVGSVKTTGQIAKTIHRTDGGERNHVVPTVKPIIFQSAPPLPMHPWLMGALIGDGTLKKGCVLFHKPEKDVQEKVISLLPQGDAAVEIVGGLRIKRSKRSNEPSETRKVINGFGLNVLSEEKFIPEPYMRATPGDRLELLRGLMDTDGSVSGSAIEYSSSSKKLSEQVCDLARSLGATCSMGSVRTPHFSYKGERRSGLPSYRMQIWFHDELTVPVSSSKHIGRLKSTGRHVHRSITSIAPCGTAECQCISVDSADGLYVTDDYILTHNTSIAMNIADHVAVNMGLPVGVFSLEMMAESLTLRMLCSRARVDSHSVRDGYLCQDDFVKLTNAASKIAKAPLHIDDTSSLSILQLRAKARRMHQQWGIKLFVIDYIQLMHSTSRRGQESRQQEVTEISAGIKALAKELKVPVLVLSQLNRLLEREKGRKPMLADLRESGSLEQDADVVGLLYKPKTENEEPEQYQPNPSVPVNLLIAKQRNGDTGEVPLTFLRYFTRFESAAKIIDSDIPH